jgi:RNA polymerase sigma-70 factor (ECF subfamily)
MFWPKIRTKIVSFVPFPHYEPKTPLLNLHHKSEEDLRKDLEQIEAAKVNPDAFGVLYEKYYKQIFVFVHRRTDNEELTADICSLTFLKAMLNLSKYRDRGLPFSSWLFRIALNEVNMYFRKSKKERCVSLDTNGVSSLASESALGNREDDRKMLMLALSRLPMEDMQLIELRFFEERPFSEVGEISGMTENNAKVRVYRILNKLKTILNSIR